MMDRIGSPILASNTNYTAPLCPLPKWDRHKQNPSWAIFGVSTGADSAGVVT